jgi:hypothetical protein
MGFSLVTSSTIFLQTLCLTLPQKDLDKLLRVRGYQESVQLSVAYYRTNELEKKKQKRDTGPGYIGQRKGGSLSWPTEGTAFHPPRYHMS